MKNFNPLTNQRKKEVISRKKIIKYPVSVEYGIGLIFVFIVGFLGIQKLIHTAKSPNSVINIYAFNESICSNGFRLPFMACDFQLADENSRKKSKDTVGSLRSKGLVNGLLKGPNAPSMRKQLAYMPDLKSSLQVLRWNNGDEQDAARFMSIVASLNGGRYNESYFVSSTMMKLIQPVWKMHPDIVAASYCLYCGTFYNDVLRPLFLEGTNNDESINALAVGHPRFLQALSQSSGIQLKDLNNIAILQAELLSSGDATTAKFIGDILLKQSDLPLLNQWTSKGWNGSYAITDYNLLLTLPRQLIIDAWQYGVTRGADNAVLTRFLVSTGYRPALRWLIWVHASNMSYFNTQQHQFEKDRYNDFIVKRYLDFPKESYNDLAGFYSKHWQNIVWDLDKKRWFYKQNPRH